MAASQRFAHTNSVSLSLSLTHTHTMGLSGMFLSADKSAALVRSCPVLSCPVLAWCNQLLVCKLAATKRGRPMIERWGDRGMGRFGQVKSG
jgi:hypothetical protein